MAAELGIEPRYWDSKSHVLPLDDSAIISSPKREPQAYYIIFIAMSHPLHSLKYQDIFSGHPASKPFELKVKGDKRLIILSDCHLDSKFDEVVYKKLVKVITEADILVVNGDFWADSGGSFEKFVTSKWKQLFPLMKSKTYYVFGNHDMPINSDERIQQFCVWAGFRLKIEIGDIRLHVEHGHLLSGSLVRKILTIFQRHPHALNLATFPFGLFEGSSRYLAKKTGSSALNKFNTGFKTRRFSVSQRHEYFAMGHTHVPEFDEEAKYLNSGRTHDGEFTYIEIYKNKVTINSLED